MRVMILLLVASLAANGFLAHDNARKSASVNQALQVFKDLQTQPVYVTKNRKTGDLYIQVPGRLKATHFRQVCSPESWL